MNRWRLHPREWGLVVSVGALLVALAWAAAPVQNRELPLAAMLPQGALMTVESGDFGAVVEAWSRSPEQRAWLSSASYSAFANSRLFTRLADAQTGFADAAKSRLDGGFLAEVAGKESIFAWYDIGNLEFLYVSRLPPDRLSKLSLLAQRGSFARREAGGTTFYVRTSSGDAGADTAQDGRSGENPGDTAPESGTGQARTVAFAVRGEWLLLSTRTDLIAGALQLMAAPQDAKGVAASEATAGWYAGAVAVGPERHGDLHMILDLQRLTKTPQFRSYWVQRNVTETRQYRAAVVDLYREPGQFREERVLLPMQPDASEMEQPDLGSLETLVPARAGVYRAWAHPGTADALSALREKVLVREPGTTAKEGVSPEAQTTVLPAGDAGNPGDFDTRIDAPHRAITTWDETFAQLGGVLEGAGLESMLTVDRSDPPAGDDAFVHVRSAVVLRAGSAWNKEALSAVVLATLRPRLTAVSVDLDWSPAGVAGRTYLTLGPSHPVCLSIEGPLAILSSDPALMEEILQRRAAAKGSTLPARRVAGFRHGQERANFRRLTADLNVAQEDAGTSADPASSGTGARPVDLFRDNLPSLSDAFQAMDEERFVETRDAGKVRQTVVYRWGDPPIAGGAGSR